MIKVFGVPVETQKQGNEVRYKAKLIAEIDEELLTDIYYDGSEQLRPNADVLDSIPKTMRLIADVHKTCSLSDYSLIVRNYAMEPEVLNRLWEMLIIAIEDDKDLYLDYRFVHTTFTGYAEEF